MDVNGTRFQLLQGEGDWSPLPESLAWRRDLGCVTLRPLLFRFPKQERLGLDDRRGAARDRYGNWYAIDEAQTGITFIPPGETTARPFWPVDAGCPAPSRSLFEPVAAPVAPPARLRGLAVTTGHYLVVGTLAPAGLLVFDLHAGGAPLRYTWPVPFFPYDLSARSQGGVWILDWSPGRAPRLWALDRFLRVEHRNQAPTLLPSAAATPFGPSDTCTPPDYPVRRFPSGLTLDLASPLDGARPLAVETLPDDTVLVLDVDPDGGATTLRRYAYGVPRGAPVRLDTLLRAALVPEALASEAAPPGSPPDAWMGYDLAFVPDASTTRRVVAGTLYVVGRDGNQAFAFTLRAEGDRLDVAAGEGFFPLRRFDGKALVAAGGEVYYDMGDQWLPLSEQPRPRFAAEGTFVSRVFDGREPGCVWHRVFVDACIPAGTSVEVETRAADEPGLLEGMPWTPEPRPYLRATGSELPYHRAFTADELRRAGTGTWEALLQDAAGRYLQVRLRLRGTGRSSPRVYALRLYYPRFSYLRQYLPALYRQDASSASFLDRFLANTEGIFTEIEGRIADVQMLFDERTANPEYLDWLASWVGALLGPAYSEATRRLFIRHAVALFGQRGTVPGLLRMIRLALDPCPDDSLFEPGAVGCGCGRDAGGVAGGFGVRIVETFQTRRAPGVSYGDASETPAPRLVADSGAPAWTPAQGAATLHALYRGFLKQRYPNQAAFQEAWGKPAAFTLEAVRLSPVPPAHPRQREDWRAFVRDALGFTYAEAAPADAAVYRTFLQRRYLRVADLNAAYGTSHAGFDAVPLPGENDFPQRNPRLYDWIQFVSLALPLHQEAHRFTVLVPTRPGDTSDAQARQVELVREIVRRERPAHTVFDVQPYWALFRAGEARVGLDTIVGEGSRFTALLLGRGGLADHYAAPHHPADVPDRIVAGRDRLPAAARL